ncbi:hypothetical protein FQA39_LY05543 [Lamprigera yunnana]|nr:hypothetical protein FQA39_LY05543 [Lamprigera yunnana]
MSVCKIFVRKMFLAAVLFMSMLVLKIGTLDPISIIPSRREQIDILKSIQEIVDKIREVVNEEESATIDGNVINLHRNMKHAANYLAVNQELVLLKAVHLQSEECALPSNTTALVYKVVEEGEGLLQICLNDAINNIYNNSQLVTTTIGEAMNQGDAFLDSLNKCSQKPGLQLISCYKKVIATDVFPLKLMLINALNVHKFNHLEIISDKHKSAECVDNVLRRQQEKMSMILKESSKHCT